MFTIPGAIVDFPNDVHTRLVQLTNLHIATVLEGGSEERATRLSGKVTGLQRAIKRNADTIQKATKSDDYASMFAQVAQKETELLQNETNEAIREGIALYISYIRDNC